MKNWSRWFKKWRALPLKSRWLLFRVAVCIVLVKIGLKVLPFKRFRVVYDFFVSNANDQTYTADYVGKLVWSVQVISSVLPFEVLCLPQALAVKYFLRFERGYGLKIGVSNHGQLFSAHAWVEKDGKIVIGEIPTINYVPLWAWS
ncbi:lasso peptide biosynthesis B2 protein [Runella sp.]|uniref:lasso peptide biosynthesis B2 protein n=1 Tax=Runella sp. TaxID=1960881 RepID=UPI003D13ACB8